MRGLLVVLGLIASVPTPADACSAPACWPGAFVPGDGATIPANAPGLYWRPMAGQEPADPGLVRLTLASDPLTPLAFSTMQLANGDYVLSPASPLIEGEQYVLEDRSTCLGTAGPRVTFTAGAQAPLPAALGSVQLLGHGTPVDLEVATISGSCSTTIEAETLSIELQRSADAEPWKDLFLYETIVDDKPWVKQAAINVRVPPGESWRGRGRDLLFRVCDANPEITGLAPGGHAVRFRASLPGVVTSVATPAQDIEVMCSGLGGGGGEDDGDGGGGCSTSRTPAPLALALALLFVRRRRSR